MGFVNASPNSFLVVLFHYLTRAIIIIRWFCISALFWFCCHLSSSANITGLPFCFITPRKICRTALFSQLLRAVPDFSKNCELTVIIPLKSCVVDCEGLFWGYPKFTICVCFFFGDLNFKVLCYAVTTGQNQGAEVTISVADVLPHSWSIHPRSCSTLRTISVHVWFFVNLEVFCCAAFQSQINSEERETPQQSSITLAMKTILIGSQSTTRRKQLLAMLPEQDVFLHLRQVSLWVDPLDATQEYSGVLLVHYKQALLCALWWDLQHLLFGSLFSFQRICSNLFR